MLINYYYYIFLALTLLGSLLLTVESTYNGTDSFSDFIESLLNPSVYNKKERPLQTSGKPVVVLVDLFVSSISGINEISMGYQINIFLRQRWNDPRLSFLNHPVFNETVTLNHELVKKFWLADLFITNERTKGSFHDITVPNVLLQVAPDGSVLYSQRISSSLACHMRLHKYPLDTQKCVLEFESYGHTTKDIVFEWRNVSKPVTVNKKMQLPEFNLTNVTVEGCTAEYTTGAFSCIKSTFTLKRLFEYYLIQVYIPSVLIVVLSWVSFWIDIQAVPARISVGLLTVLTITTQSSGISSKLPRVSYIKAIDVWMFTSMLFVFGALIEYSVVNVLARGHQNKVDALKKKREEENVLANGNAVFESDEKYESMDNGTYTKVDPSNNNNHDIKERHNSLPRNRIEPVKDSTSVISVSSGPNEKKMSWFRRILFNKALMVDTLSRLVFPAAFIFFNCYYWISYLTPDN